MLRVVHSKLAAPASPQEEQALILAAQQGDSDAFREIYESYRDRVYNLIYYTLNREHAAEDVLQTVFVKVFQALPCFRLESSFHTWIYRVALNECKNRKRRKKLFVSMSVFDEGLKEPAAQTTPHVEHATQQRNQQVRAAVLALSPKLREVVVLKYLEELSYEEVAATLDCSPGTVASRLHRALSELAIRLGPAQVSHSVEGVKR